MSASVYAVERIKQLMDCLVNQAVSPMVVAGNEIDQVERWLEDEKSKEQYRRELAFWVLSQSLLKDFASAVSYTGNFNLDEWFRVLQQVQELRASGALPLLEGVGETEYAETFILNQYEYSGAVEIQKGDVFLDCGAFVGDTAVWALSKGAGKVYSFEPGSESMKNLILNTQAISIAGGGVVPVPFGVGGETARMRMVGSGSGAQLVKDESGEVMVVTLDDWCRENAVRPDFIKMDIEGAEVDALKGARGVITQYKPKLTICLYHRLTDMWVIPHLIKEMVPEYRFWCRKNHPNYEFVLYATV
ncbi:hypothetical protein FACS1894116_06770 [Betaproteobacteria bacterium]|nr:hypothetical protein FACS1894116_06770 [Betaproteobacteria bacterium]GHT98051.1 hypothetical protein FACS1894154_02720 [Betaproteobacteria bacterium]GHU24332.1 hypothetical protein FACS189488_08740 [Betaproteobacteria bacterium]GHU31679.1 hypothetical protein FACS189497_12700 [Betaproteobacteria bacterium]